MRHNVMHYQKAALKDVYIFTECIRHRVRPIRWAQPDSSSRNTSWKEVPIRQQAPQLSITEIGERD